MSVNASAIELDRVTVTVTVIVSANVTVPGVGKKTVLGLLGEEIMIVTAEQARTSLAAERRSLTQEKRPAGLEEVVETKAPVPEDERGVDVMKVSTARA